MPLRAGEVAVQMQKQAAEEAVPIFAQLDRVDLFID